KGPFGKHGKSFGALGIGELLDGHGASPCEQGPFRLSPVAMQASGLTAWELFCRRGDRLLFGSLDLWLERGEALHLVGPNGIGKTSLIQILAGLRRPSDRGFHSEPPARGRVHWEGSIGLVDHRP